MFRTLPIFFLVIFSTLPLVTSYADDDNITVEDDQVPQWKKTAKAHEAFPGVGQLSEEEFHALAAEVAPKVNLFRTVWAQDPEAEFYGGTSRDFLYWLKGQFTTVKSRSEALQVVDRLKQTRAIDVRSFIIGDSDVDVISTKTLALNPRDFEVRKIDSQPVDIFEPHSEAGFNELHQGYAPAEKIRLGRKGVVAFPALGNGLQEIYRGKLSVHFASAEDFAKTKYAIEGTNHPSLLALRYMRLLAINYFRTYGKDFPDAAKLEASLDPQTAAAVKKIINSARESGELKTFLDNTRFRSWANGSIQKAFRSYTNPAAAMEVMKMIGVDKLVNRYAGQLEPINQYLFAQFRDPGRIAENLRKANVPAADLYLDPKKVFSDGYLYHGTKSDEAFRAIILQGALPSTSDSMMAGNGLYGTAVEGVHLVDENVSRKDLLLKFPVLKSAKIIDIRQGIGKTLWEKFQETKGNYDQFAEIYGADILLYPWGNNSAFVVKNSAVLGNAAGVHKDVLRLEEIYERIKSISSLDELRAFLGVHHIPVSDWSEMVAKSGVPIEALREFALKCRFFELPLVLPIFDPANKEDQNVFRKLMAQREELVDEALFKVLDTHTGPETDQLLFELFQSTRNSQVEKRLYHIFSNSSLWVSHDRDPKIKLELKRHELEMLNIVTGSKHQPGINTFTVDFPLAGTYRALYGAEVMLENPGKIKDVKILANLLILFRPSLPEIQEVLAKTNFSPKLLLDYLSTLENSEGKSELLLKLASANFPECVGVFKKL